MDILAVNNFGDTRSGGLAGPMGLFIIVLMSIATVLLIRNMNKRLRRLPDSFPDAKQTQREAEIARLNADLVLSMAEEPALEAHPERTKPAATGAEGEVNGVTTASDPKPTDGGTRPA